MIYLTLASRRLVVLLFLLACCGPMGCGSQPPPDPAAPVADLKAAPDRPHHPATPASTAEPAIPSTFPTGGELSLAGPNAEEPAPVAPGIQPQPQPREQPQPVFRPSDNRPRHDDARLAKFGIFRYESKRLRLYTDIDPGVAETLPPVLDQVYPAWEAYFGELPPNRERTPFQVTGYLMTDKELFTRAGLVPADLPGFLNGRHRGAEFWMHEQQHDYYRRHLLIHEATHCYMTIVPDVRAPVWYMEGMAELFGTHAVDADGKYHFRVMPSDKREFVGLGRINLVQLAVEAGRFRSLDEVLSFAPNAFLKNEAYAWSWALCAFLDGHPRYRARFSDLGGRLTGTQFQTAFHEAFHRELPNLHAEWPLFIFGLEYGYDLERSLIDFQPGTPLSEETPSRGVEIVADRGWQPSGVLVTQDREYEVTAAGRFTLAQKPKPWISEPQGISFRYAGGRPIGLVLAAIHSQKPSDGTAAESMLRVIPIGRQARFTAETTGTLYFRVNDSWSDLANNTGGVQVQIREVLKSIQ